MSVGARFGRVALGTIYVGFFLDIFQFAVLLPLFKNIVARVEEDNDRVPHIIGMLTQIAALLETIVSPFWGALADRSGRKVVMLICTMGSASSAAVFSCAGSFREVLAGRIVNAVSGSSFSLSQACIADITTPEERPDYIILIAGLAGVAFTVGPVLGSWLNANFGLSAAYAVCSAVGFLNSAAIVLLWRETNPGVAEPQVREVMVPERQGGQEQNDQAAVSNAAYPPWYPKPVVALSKRTRALFDGFNPLIVVLFMGNLFLAPLHSAFEICGNVYVTDEFCEGDSVCGAQIFSQCYSIMGFSLLFMSFVVYKPLQRRIGIPGTIMAGALLGATGPAIMATASSPAVFVAGTLVWSVGSELMGPSIPLLITRLSKPSAYGKAFGVNKSFSFMARAVMPSAFVPIFTFRRSLIFAYISVCMAMTALVLFSLSIAVVDAPREGAGDPVDGDDLDPVTVLPHRSPWPELERASPRFDWARQVSQHSKSAVLDFGALGSHLLMLQHASHKAQRRCVSEELPRDILDLAPGAGTELASRTF